MDHSDISAVRRAIESLLFTHRRRPFGLLREAAVAAELKRWTDQFLWGRNFVNASIVDMPEKAIGPVVETDRVRLEAGLLLPRNNPDEEPNPVFEVDLVVYRTNNVALERHRSGPGDVVLRTNADGILAAVEIKASPSHQLGEKLHYASDIARLLLLRQMHGVAGFFLLLDKSSPLYGPTELHRVNWGGAQPRTLTEVVYENNPRAQQNARWNNIVISLEPTSPVHIEIWDVSSPNENSVRFYASYA